MKRPSILIICFFTFAFSQLQYSGYVYPSQMIGTANGKEISLPFRLSELKLGYSTGDFDIKFNSSLEYRWSNSEYEAELRELYMIWYPAFGEISIGKQVLAWGAVDGNNPTDNLNAYNYYYMFLTGTDRKVGSTSILVNYYLGDWKFSGVFINEHVSNKLPFNEPDFPLDIPAEPNQYLKVEDPVEYGLKVQTLMGESDVSLSWFKGHDRGFSIAGISPTNGLVAGFRETIMIGADFVTFINNFTLRGEGAYFFTETAYQSPFDTKAEYGQYALQAEYTTGNDITINGQLIGNYYGHLSGTTINPINGMVVPVSKDNFQMGMGMPFSTLTDSGLMITGSGDLYDNRLELKGILFQNLDGTGTMLGGEAEYSPIENWIFHLSLNHFIGDNGDSENTFTMLEDFSHIRFGLEYNF
ncbi:MAG: hypothetical protein ACE5D7_00325 [Fidelibacterota bacterium]